MYRTVYFFPHSNNAHYWETPLQATEFSCPQFTITRWAGPRSKNQRDPANIDSKSLEVRQHTSLIINK